MFEFSITHRDSRARTGDFHTPHGDLETPELAIVATDGHIKSVDIAENSSLPMQYNIVNTFHIYTKKILTDIIKSNGIHTYGNFKSVIASDSGGFQVFSLGFGKSHQVGKIGGFFPGEEATASDTDNPITITETGVTFAFNGEPVTLTPEKSMEIQHGIGADIMFAFDECTSPLNSKEYTAQALDRTHAWIHQCITAHKPHEDKQALFAIVQGGFFRDLREQSAKYMGALRVPGFGIGGSLGKTKEDMYDILDWTLPLLPDEKPRHLLGIGQVRDIFEAVERGIDLFDCVIPTREARHKVVYTKRGKIAVRKMRQVNEVIESGCACKACASNITFATLAQMFTERNPLAYYYATVHNIQFFNDLMKEIREAIEKQNLHELKEAYFKVY